MADLTTWIFVAAALVVVAAIVVGSIAVAARRRRHRLDASSRDHAPGKGEAPYEPDALGDRSEFMHRARRGF